MNLPDEIILQQLLLLDYKTLNATCNTNKRIKTICDQKLNCIAMN
jgi:hypothetical protein